MLTPVSCRHYLLPGIALFAHIPVTQLLLLLQLLLVIASLNMSFDESAGIEAVVNTRMAAAVINTVFHSIKVL